MELRLNKESIPFERWTIAIKHVVALLFIILLAACSTPPSPASLLEALQAEGLQPTQLHAQAQNSQVPASLQGISSVQYQLDKNELLYVYHFNSVKQREEGQADFQIKQGLLSSHAPLVYANGNDLLLYYNRNSQFSDTQTSAIHDTKFGEAIQRALDTQSH